MRPRRHRPASKVAENQRPCNRQVDCRIKWPPSPRQVSSSYEVARKDGGLQPAGSSADGAIPTRAELTCHRRAAAAWSYDDSLEVLGLLFAK
jgi:hypothetical protein